MTARYREIAAELRKKIESGEYPPGGNLPGYGELTSAYGVGRGVIRSALSLLEADGLIQVIKKRGIIVRHGTMRLRRPRGNLVKRNVATASPGYSFPSASGQEVWTHHLKPQATFEPLTDARIAGLLGVPVGTEVMRRFRVTGPVAEPPFQINISWIHPRGVEDAPEVASQAQGPGTGSTVWNGQATGPSLGWKSTAPACRRRKRRRCCRSRASCLCWRSCELARPAATASQSRSPSTSWPATASKPCTSCTVTNLPRTHGPTTNRMSDQS